MTPGVEVSALADPRRRRSQGVLVEASVLARLLGLRLLRLEATVVLVPADVSPGRPPVRSARVPRARSDAVGGALARAVRSIDEGAELLADARRESRRLSRVPPPSRLLASELGHQGVQRSGH